MLAFLPQSSSAYGTTWAGTTPPPSRATFDNPQRNYPRAMIGAAIITAVTYVLPLAAMAVGGLSPDGFTTGSWAIAGGQRRRFPILSMAVVAGGVICGIGMFNALMMSYTRLPIAMAADGMLPHIFERRNSRGVPWISVLVCGLGWALALSLPFETAHLHRPHSLRHQPDSRIRSPSSLCASASRDLPRPFRAGNFAFACLLGVGPTLLIAYALYASRSREAGRSGHRPRQRLISSFCVWDCPARAAALLVYRASRSPAAALKPLQPPPNSARPLQSILALDEGFIHC